MLQKEFEDILHTTVSSSEFNAIHETYMATKMDKEAFCADWKKHRGSTIIADLMEKVTFLERKLQEYNLMLANANADMKRFALEVTDQLIGIQSAPTPEAIANTIIHACLHFVEVGEDERPDDVAKRTYIKRKIEAGQSLSANDLEILKNVL